MVTKKKRKSKTKKLPRVKKAQRGKKLTSGRGWVLVPTKGKERTFRGTLLQTYNFSRPTRIAVFSVPK